MRFAISDRRRVVLAQPAPRQNHLLAALPEQEFQRLLPDLEPFTLPSQWTVHDAGDNERYLYFITAGIVSRFTVTANGASAEFAVTGNEGVTEAVGRLQKEGLIHSSCGHTAVVDRPALEAHACGCYADVKRDYDGLLADLDLSSCRTALSRC